MNNIEKLEKAIFISKLYIKSLEMELGKLKADRDELSYKLKLEKAKNTQFQQMEKGELKEIRKQEYVEKLLAKNSQLEKDRDYWRNKCISKDAKFENN